MKKVLLVLARGMGKPDGDVEDRLELQLGLNGQGQLDLPGFESRAQPWLATHVRHGAPLRALEVARADERWILQSADSEDDPIWVFEGQVFRPGELVVLLHPGGDELLYRIVGVDEVVN